MVILCQAERIMIAGNMKHLYWRLKLQKNGLIRIPNSRGNDSVILQAVTVPFVENGQRHNFHVPILVSPILAELDPDWTSFGNIISEHFDIFTSARRHEMHLSPNEMAVVDTIQASFSIVKITVPGEEVRICGDLPSLGRWYPKHGASMNPQGHNLWTSQIWLPKNIWFEWKFVVFNTNTNTTTWEGFTSADNRRSYVLPGVVFNEIWKPNN